MPRPSARLVKTPRATPTPARPTSYQRALANAVCERLAAGEALDSIATDPTMPAAETIAGWVLDNTDGFTERFERCRKVRAVLWEDELLRIADDGSGDWKETARGMTANTEHLSRSKLRIEVRRWLLSKWLPCQFGDKLGLGSDSEAPVKVTIVQYGDEAEP